MNYSSKIRGITVIEILFTVAILAVLSQISISVFSGLANSQALDRDVTIVANYIDKARTMSINSVNSLVHGIKFESSKITLFQSSTFSLANTVDVYDIPAQTTISNISLTGANTSLYFNKLTGVPSATGTITLTDSQGERSKSIIIYGTGVVDIQ
jgi:Tfp pilus assembly protein FimT